MYYKIFPIDFLFDEIDSDSSFFIIMNVYIVQTRIFRLSEGLFGEAYSIIEITFEPSIEFQSFTHSTELHLSCREILFILQNLKLIEKSSNNVSNTFLILYPIPKLFEFRQQSSMFLHFVKNFQSSNS